MTTEKVSIRYLIDVAIGNPDPGIVNFNALYTVLLAISEKLDLQDVNIEIDSSFCPVGVEGFHSKSNVSSEKLITHLIFDYNSETDPTKVEEPLESERKKLSTQPEHEQDQVKMSGEIRKVGFDKSDVVAEDTPRTRRTKDAERLELYRSELRQHIDALNARLGKIENLFSTSGETENNVEHLEKIFYEFQEKFAETVVQIEELRESRNLQERDISACRKRLDFERMAIAIDEVKEEIDELKATVGMNKKEKKSSNASTDGDSGTKGNHSHLQNQLMDVNTTVCGLTEKFAEMKISLDICTKLATEAMSDAINHEFKEHIQNAIHDLYTLKTKHDEQTTLVDELVGKVGELTNTKIDKEEIDELLSEKADYTMLQRKVSVENVDADRRKLQKQICEVTDCFVINEERVQRQINDIKKFLGDQSLEDLLFGFKVKVDKDIQVVRDAIRRLAEMKPDVDAAAARLRDLQCLSCDQEVVMRAVETNNLSKFGDAYVSKTNGPSITFHIGDLRDAQKIGMDIFGETPNSFRHSGGTHTIITNKDRVDKTRSHKRR